jgi:hypothetical protein
VELAARRVSNENLEACFHAVPGYCYFIYIYLLYYISNIFILINIVCPRSWDREEAERILAGRPCGTFLVRYTSTKAQLAVSVVVGSAPPSAGSQVLHQRVRIEPRAEPTYEGFGCWLAEGGDEEAIEAIDVIEDDDDELAGAPAPATGEQEYFFVEFPDVRRASLNELLSVWPTEYIALLPYVVRRRCCACGPFAGVSCRLNEECVRCVCVCGVCAVCGGAQEVRGEMAALRDSEPMPQVASPLLSLADELLLAIFEHLPAAALCSLVQVTLVGRTRTRTRTHAPT